MKIASNILELVGRTPLLELARFSKNRGCKAKVIGKVEYFNPAGSIKDRVALNMVLQADWDANLVNYTVQIVIQNPDEQNEYDYKLVHFISNYFAKILIFID